MSAGTSMGTCPWYCQEGLYPGLRRALNQAWLHLPKGAGMGAGGGRWAPG